MGVTKYSVCLSSMQRTIDMHVLTFKAVSSSETQLNKLVTGFKIGTFMIPFPCSAEINVLVSMFPKN